ncbi:hypothetical protein GQ43DRAFT_202709 [Delitschia confertaspora ATCC 74209]|uniref:Uncharacterized protein n=1 Tax=Delitschia confertaspora ATCC 74209 TaxID=1513339 RepID=A0A9P4JIU6_9PLEO|nr:hypothetical protein GQ43DRAFT_202709 [Delitschia confertaspora ATCC 74209]
MAALLSSRTVFLVLVSFQLSLPLTYPGKVSLGILVVLGWGGFSTWRLIGGWNGRYHFHPLSPLVGDFQIVLLSALRCAALLCSLYRCFLCFHAPVSEKKGKFK